MKQKSTKFYRFEVALCNDGAKTNGGKTMRTRNFKMACLMLAVVMMFTIVPVVAVDSEIPDDFIVAEYDMFGYDVISEMDEEFMIASSCTHAWGTGVRGRNHAGTFSMCTIEYQTFCSRCNVIFNDWHERRQAPCPRIVSWGHIF